MRLYFIKSIFSNIFTNCKYFAFGNYPNVTYLYLFFKLQISKLKTSRKREKYVIYNFINTMNKKLMNTSLIKTAICLIYIRRKWLTKVYLVSYDKLSNQRKIVLTMNLKLSQ